MVDIDGREIHVRIVNPEQKDTVFCWHGLLRNGEDFSQLAVALAQHGYRVIMPDMIGRGWSQWASNPEEEYQYPNYLSIATGLIDYYKVTNFSWVGTSMGGIMGMMLAATSLKDQINALMINDIGAEVPVDAIARIKQYANAKKEFHSFSQFTSYLRELYTPFGERSEQDWLAMAKNSCRRLDSGKLAFHNDPAIGEQLQIPDEPVNLWPFFQLVECPILLLHGKQSDVLSDSIVEQMRSMKPDLAYLGFESCGHAPGLHLDAHINPVVDFIQRCKA